MSEMKHTPGPWTAADDRRGIWEIIANGEMLGQVWRIGNPNDLPAEANARLMAASPDLLAALEAIYAKCNTDSIIEITQEVMDQCAAAIQSTRAS